MNHNARSLLEQHLTSSLKFPPHEVHRLFHGRGRRWPELEQVTVNLAGWCGVGVAVPRSGGEGNGGAEGDAGSVGELTGMAA